MVPPLSAALALSVVLGAEPGRHFLATYFLDNGQAGVYFAVSRDGLKFEPLVSPNVPVLAPRVGRERLMRDACLCRGPDGTWHMTWTTGWWERGFGHAWSRDLVDWSEQRYIEAMRGYEGAVNCWAPEAVYDAARGEYLIVWSSTVKGAFSATEAGGDAGPNGVLLNHRFYCASTRDFVEFGPTRLCYDPGFSCIDATLLAPGPTGGPWHLFLKDETRTPARKNIRALTLGDPWRPEASAPITGSYWAEGPSALRVDGKVRVYFDRYTENRFGAVESADFERWADISDSISFPQGARHSTVIETDEATVRTVREALALRASRPADPSKAAPAAD